MVGFCHAKGSNEIQILFHTAVLSVPQMPSLSEAEQDLPKRDNMLLAAVSVLVIILLLALIAIASLVAFILCKLKLSRDSHGEIAYRHAYNSYEWTDQLHS